MPLQILFLREGNSQIGIVVIMSIFALAYFLTLQTWYGGRPPLDSPEVDKKMKLIPKSCHFYIATVSVIITVYV